MATHPSISKSPLLRPGAGAKRKKSKPFRLMIARTPDIWLHDDIVSSPVEDGVAARKAGVVIAAGKFKATCLQLLDRAAKGEIITITKRGRVVGRLVPPEPDRETPFVPLLGRMQGMVRIKGDVVGPRFDWWEKK